MSESKTFLHHVGITAPAKVLDEVVDFYGVVLGLEPGYRPKFGGIGGFWYISRAKLLVKSLEQDMH